MPCLQTSVNILTASTAEVPTVSSVGIVSPLNYTLFEALCELVHRPSSDSLNQPHVLFDFFFACSFLGHIRTSNSPPCSIAAKQSTTECDGEGRRVGCTGGMGSLPNISEISLSYFLTPSYLLEFSVL